MADKQAVEDHSPADSVNPALVERLMRKAAELVEFADACWVDYDRAVDVMYVRFGLGSKTRAASDSEMTEDDVVLHFDGDDLVGLTVMNASKRKSLGKILGAYPREVNPP